MKSIFCSEGRGCEHYQGRNTSYELVFSPISEWDSNRGQRKAGPILSHRTAKALQCVVWINALFQIYELTWHLCPPTVNNATDVSQRQRPMTSMNPAGVFQRRACDGANSTGWWAEPAHQHFPKVTKPSKFTPRCVKQLHGTPCSKLDWHPGYSYSNFRDVQSAQSSARTAASNRPQGGFFRFLRRSNSQLRILHISSWPLHKKQHRYIFSECFKSKLLQTRQPPSTVWVITVRSQPDSTPTPVLEPVYPLIQRLSRGDNSTWAWSSNSPPYSAEVKNARRSSRSAGRNVLLKSFILRCIKLMSCEDSEERDKDKSEGTSATLSTRYNRIVWRSVKLVAGATHITTV